MAIDTATKRRQAASTLVNVPPSPDGTIDATDRAELAGSYAAAAYLVALNSKRLRYLATTIPQLPIPDLTVDRDDVATLLAVYSPLTPAAPPPPPPSPTLASPRAAWLAADELLDLIDVVQRRESVKYEVLDSRLEWLFDIHPIVGNAQIRVDANATVKRTLSDLRLTPDDEARIDVFAHRLRPVWQIEVARNRQVVVAGTETTRPVVTETPIYADYPLGVFVFSSADRVRQPWGIELTATLHDQSVILNQARETGLSLPAGANIVDAALSIIAECGIPSVQVKPSEMTVSAPVAWPAGTSRLEILNQLCGMLGYHPVYFDNEGRLRARAAEYPIVDLPPDHTYRLDETSRVVTGTITETSDLLDAANRYIVRSSAPSGTEIVGYYDLPANAPQSIARRGYVIASVSDEPGISDSATATAAAARNAAQARTYLHADFTATADPRHDIFDIVDYLGDNYRETGWELELKTGGRHTHHLRRTY